MGTIPAALVPEIFEPLLSREKRNIDARGLGLGLFISREIVEAHGGTICVHSDPERGTTFTVALPRTDAHASGGPESIIIARADGGAGGR